MLSDESDEHITLAKEVASIHLAFHNIEKELLPLPYLLQLFPSLEEQLDSQIECGNEQVRRAYHCFLCSGYFLDKGEMFQSISSEYPVPRIFHPCPENVQ